MEHTPIDRKALVRRHNMRPADIERIIPLGNGEFCFGCDRTGLQNFGGNAMSHWAWHHFPTPEGIHIDDWPETGSFYTGRLTGDGSDYCPSDRDADRFFIYGNPHAANLGRLRFVHADGSELAAEEIVNSQRECDLWTGILNTEFQFNGKPVQVTSCVHAQQDTAAVKIVSPALKDGSLAIAFDFPYPTLEFCYSLGDFHADDRHETKLALGDGAGTISRHADDLNYRVNLTWTCGNWEQTGPHCLLLKADCDILELVIRYEKETDNQPVPTFAETMAASAAGLEQYWLSGGAIDLSGSSDERWFELERRIVLSQYLMAVQSRGSYPCGESGLMFIDGWNSQFHMEMMWWHIAHYGLWSRMECADKQLGCYKQFLPMAKKLAAQLDYPGAKWGKMVGPEGRTAPWIGNLALLWKQPHPIFFAELEYLNRPTEETLEKWAEIIHETAVHMADYPVLKDDGYYHLDPVMPPSELGFTYDTVFDLAYWRWALETAQVWRQRMGLARVAKWDEVAYNLAPLPTQDGVYIRSPEWTETYTTQTYEHPDPVGVYGMLPPTEMVSRKIAKATVKKVWQCWDLKRIWGWDFPWISMCAARTDEPELAVEAILSGYMDEIGCSCEGSYPYIPANGAILYASAMMAVGRNGEHAPGFPKDGKWVVRHENIKGW